MKREEGTKLKEKIPQKRKRIFILLILAIGYFIGVHLLIPAVQSLSNPFLRTVSFPLSPINDSLSGKPEINSQSAILVDVSSGKTLLEKNADIAYPVASMSKLMTEYIVLEQIKNGNIEWDDMVEISRSANDIDPRGVKLYIAEGDSLTVRDLFNAMVISSANNAAKALAEYIAGTEDEFAEVMNDKAQEIGLSDKTHFVNSTGLFNQDGIENVMTAEDVATLAYRLLQDSPEIVETTKLQVYQLEFDGTVLKNTNEMLDTNNRELYFDLVDGLKTGFTEAAGYCFTGTAVEGEKRLVSVVMGANDNEARFEETYKLLSFGFNSVSMGQK